MILVDTSVWVDHLRTGEPRLAALLGEGAVLTHPFVIEELACGHLTHRDEVLELLAALPLAPVASHAELLHFIASERLCGAGLGVVDAHLLASARLAGANVWTKDRALVKATKRLNLFLEAERHA